jgi:hypothetical protein
MSKLEVEGTTLPLCSLFLSTSHSTPPSPNMDGSPWQELYPLVQEQVAATVSDPSLVDRLGIMILLQGPHFHDVQLLPSTPSVFGIPATPNLLYSLSTFMLAHQHFFLSSHPGPPFPHTNQSPRSGHIMTYLIIPGCT